ncbi:phosphoadenosine phosphosulfate reductase family protein [Pseudopedobacter beijingensis]|uniref:Phosphoadenosine phosphosulfate reductase family protein n=1 Tax=Pseudopedobacter beijingensis TaxID=1207056 RepID=A0ABW4IIQ9_9SPHI
MKGIQLDFFREPHILKIPCVTHGLEDMIKESGEIVQKAIIDYNPYSCVLMLSGGDDSITALHVAIMLGVRIDFIIHGVTGTGLPAVRKYVHKVAELLKIKIIEADAGTTFEDYVKRKGFFGKGKDAHTFSYHLLKVNPFNRVISKYIRKGISGRKILLLNGVRVEESENRADNFGDNPYRIYGSDIWVNIIHWWTKRQCLQLLESNNFERNPVSVSLGRSGECNCGTMQSDTDRQAASDFDPIWGKWLLDIRRYCIKTFGWDINQNPKKETLLRIKAEASKLNEFMPMCVGCKSRQLSLDLKKPI